MDKKFQHALWFLLSVTQPKDEELKMFNDMFDRGEKDITAKALESFKNYKSSLENPYLQYMHSPQQIANMGLLAGIFIGLASLSGEEFRRQIEKTAAEMAPDPEKLISFKLKSAEIKGRL